MLFQLLFRYGSSGCGPRPEMFIEDNDWAQSLHDKEDYFANVKAASESTYESSTRWMINFQVGYFWRVNENVHCSFVIFVLI